MSVLLLGSGIILSQSPVQAEVVNLGPGLKQVPAGGNFDYLIDASLNLTIEEVEARESGWLPMTSDLMNFGVTGHAYWIRFRVYNPDSEKARWLLNTGIGNLNDFDLYYKNSKGIHKRGEIKFNSPFSLRKVFDRNITFPLESDPGEHAVVYLRMYSHSVSFMPPRIYSYTEFQRIQFNEWALFGTIYGFFLLTAIYHLFMFFGLRSKAYLYYFLYIILLGFHMAGLNGHTFQYLWPEHPVFDPHSIGIFVLMAVFALFHFIRHFTGLENYSILLDRVYVYSAASMIPISIYFALETNYFRMTLMISVLGTLIILLQYLSMIYLAIVYKSREIRYYLGACTLFFAGTLSYVLCINNIIPFNFMTFYGNQFGAALEVALIGLGLAHRLRTNQQDIRRNGERYKKTMEKSRDLIFMLDQRFNFISVNPAAAELLNYAPQDLLGTNFLDLFDEKTGGAPGVSRLAAQIALEKVFQDKSHMEFRGSVYERFNPEPRDYLMHLSFMRGAGRPEVFGRASPLTEDILTGFLQNEKSSYHNIKEPADAEVFCRLLTRKLGNSLSPGENRRIRDGLSAFLTRALALKENECTRADYELGKGKLLVRLSMRQAPEEWAGLIELFDSCKTSRITREIVLEKDLPRAEARELL